MGPYCKFCDQRCFLLRVLSDGRSMLLATCPRGMEYDRKVCGQDHTTAINPAAPDPVVDMERYRCKVCGGFDVDAEGNPTECSGPPREEPDWEEL